MRVTGRRAAITAAIVVTAAMGAAAQDDKGREIMAQVRKALGGEQKVTAVKGLSLRASYQREMSMPAMAGGGRATIMINQGPAAGGDTPQVTGEIEIDVELPSRYIKVDTSIGFMAMTRTEGFDGDRPFADVASANPGMRIQIDRPGGDAASAQRALHRHQAELARLLLGVLGSTQASFPATYTYAGVAESPDGKAHIIEVKGPEDFSARLFVDVQTNLPLMLTYMAPEPRVIMRTAERGQGRQPVDPARVEEERQRAESAPATMVEYRIFFSDYRDVGSLVLPHRIGRGTAQKTTEEWEVTSYKINPALKADRFKIS